jgi:serine protease
LRLPERMPVTEAEGIAKRLESLPEVEYAEPDLILIPLGEQVNTPQITPNDPLYGSQWHYFAPSSGDYGVDAPAAWDITTGSTGVYIAVLDTGITDHADLSGRWTGGYDMITDINTANDGDERDSDPHDPGDWIAADECYAGSPAQDSSWHGTHVAGTIAAATNNNLGVAGLNWVSQVIPVRVLGKCGGSISDIVDAIRWAAGLSVTGVPNNPHPAQIINMSLGGSGTCDSTIQGAINDVVNAGTTVVVAAGNNNVDAGSFVPANCNNVITVAATDRHGDRAYYSNYGSVVEIAAPGGDTRYSGSGILSTLNTGTQGPVDDTYEYYQGTSMAAPHVSGVASLLYSVKSSITPSEVLSTLQNTVTAFPSGSTCDTSNCGSGIVNAGAAVAAVSNVPPTAPILAAINNPDGDGNYLVDWNDVGNVISYTLQEDDNAGFTSPTTVYSNTASQHTVSGQADGTWYYRVRASNSYGSSDWSNTVYAYVGDLQKVYLPLTLKNYSAPMPANWVTITTLDFEGAFPGSWTLSPSTSGDYTWGKRNCQANTGTYSGWAIGDGTTGSGLSCGSNYPNDANIWMVYGPFDLSSAQTAELVFYRWLNTEWNGDKHDYFFWGASDDGANFSGFQNYGVSGGWDQKTLDLTDHAGKSEVWVAFKFGSDSDTTLPNGVFLDDVVLRMCTSNCPTSLAASPGEANPNLAEIPVVEVFSR